MSMDSGETLSDHVRSVHFALLLVSAGLAIGALQTPRAQSVMARAEGEAINQIFSDWRIISRAALTPVVKYHGRFSWEGFGTLYEVELTDGAKEYWVPVLNVIKDGRVVRVREDGTLDVLKERRTFHFFRSLWEAKFELLLPTSETQEVLCYDKYTTVKKLSIVSSTKVTTSKGVGTSDMSATLARALDRELRDRFAPRGLFVAETGRCVIDVFEQSREVDLRAAMRQHVRDLNVGPMLGDFSRAFPNLSKAIEGSVLADEVATDRAVQELRRIESLDVERAEMFGLKIPMDMLSAIGVPALVSLQFYLWVHLCNLAQILPNAERVPVGNVLLYVQVPSRVFAVASIAMPVFVIGFLLLRSNARLYGLQFLVVLSSCAIVFMTVLQLRQIWSECTRRHTPSSRERPAELSAL